MAVALTANQLCLHCLLVCLAAVDLPLFAPQVWDVSSGTVVFELGVKSVNKDAWPMLHYGPQDASLFHGVTNTVHQYSRADGFKSELTLFCMMTAASCCCEGGPQNTKHVEIGHIIQPGTLNSSIMAYCTPPEYTQQAPRAHEVDGLAERPW
jgi:hypothetical protein